jgi:hypothetical protein
MLKTGLEVVLHENEFYTSVSQDLAAETTIFQIQKGTTASAALKYYVTKLTRG